MRYYLDTEFHEYAKKPYFGMFGKPINTIELISIGIVCEDGREYYAISKDFDVDAAWENDWLRENVLHPIEIETIKKYHGDARNRALNTYSFGRIGLKRLIRDHGKSNDEIAQEIVRFVMPEYVEKSYGGRIDLLNGYWVKDIHQNPKLHAYYADYDWVVFCQLFGRMIDLPKGFPMYCIDLKQILDKTRFETSDNVQMWGVELKNHQSYPKQENEHDALSDARWSRKLHDFLLSLP